MQLWLRAHASALLTPSHPALTFRMPVHCLLTLCLSHPADFAAEVALSLRAHASALGAVAESAAGGGGMKPAHHADAVKAMVGAGSAF